MTTTRLLVPTLAGAALLTTACNQIDLLATEDGSGIPETTTYEPADLDQIEVASAFEVTVLIEPEPPTVVGRLLDRADLTGQPDIPPIQGPFDLASTNFDRRIGL
jgi:hypothetical protein